VAHEHSNSATASSVLPVTAVHDVARELHNWNGKSYPYQYGTLYLSSVCKTSFFWLRQLRRVSRSLDTESLKALVHAFVTSRVNYCNSVLASSPKTIADELQRVLNAACSSDLWHRQVRSRSVTAVPQWTALAWYSSAGAVQACRDCSPTPGVKHRRTLPITAFPSVKSLVASTYDPPDANNSYWMYNGSAVSTVVAPLHPPVRQSEIHCRTIFAIRLSDRTSFNEN